MQKHFTELRVRYADTDQMRFAYNGKYFEYFEVGRTEMMREVGLPYEMIEKSGFFMPVIETKIHFFQPAFYDELLLIETRVEKLPTSKVHIAVSYTHLRAHETVLDLVCRLLLDKKT